MNKILCALLICFFATLSVQAQNDNEENDNEDLKKRLLYLAYDGGQWSPLGLRFGQPQGFFISLRTSDILPTNPGALQYELVDFKLNPENSNLRLDGDSDFYSRYSVKLGYNVMFTVSGAKSGNKFLVGGYGAVGYEEGSERRKYVDRTTDDEFWVTNRNISIRGIGTEVGIQLIYSRLVLLGGVSYVFGVDSSTGRVTESEVSKNLMPVFGIGITL